MIACRKFDARVLIQAGQVGGSSTRLEHRASPGCSSHHSLRTVQGHFRLLESTLYWQRIVRAGTEMLTSALVLLSTQEVVYEGFSAFHRGDFFGLMATPVLSLGELSGALPMVHRGEAGISGFASQPSGHGGRLTLS
eukprot:CAMPEP_0170617808 /NCGR_PEP_ID=MMETSP0224-20130122/26620_1 /TAXON_ID=285029 /ORGANISM="Togula jolla, Strain CCCM 725" /LENGTH=136 /DNA_ID=CAMNT_0010943735 /DNA_START=248 /DNA_END=655 /DNA_ORIENTATION=+